MSSLPHTLYRAREVRELDRLAVERAGISGETLMARAGAAVFACLRERWPRARRLAVVCGMGNNGGDGFVIARLARAAGCEVEVILPGGEEALRGHARAEFLVMRQAGLEARPLAQGLAPGVDVVVDALFGTGLDRELAEPWRTAVAAINQSGAPVIAVDIPSGLHADTGRVLGAAVRADVTVSFIGLKQGLFTGEGPALCGEIIYDRLGVPESLFTRVTASAMRIDAAEVNRHLAPRPRTAHKGQHGHVLVAGGDYGMAGAARMAGEAAARAGAGLVTVATRPEHAPVIAAARPELMAHGVSDAAALRVLLEKTSVLAIGPGLGRGTWARELFGAALDSKLPMVVDADALALLAQEPCACERWVLTPHPGEAARLLGCSVREVQDDRFRAVREIQRRYRGVCVLKGAGSLICAGEGTPVMLCDAGNPGMAGGGFGDVLTGIVAGLLAQGLSPAQAAASGVYVHARAADLAAREGERGMLASDVLPYVRRLVNPQAD